MVENRPQDPAKTYSEMFRAAAAAQDIADYHHAIAGRDVGRIGKNFSRQGIDPETGERGKDGSSRLQRTLDWLLLNDASYAGAHRSAMMALTDAENSVANGLAEILQTLADERRALEELVDRAARLPDGTRVFRKANGDIVDADDNPIPQDVAAGIEWRGDEPTYEEYRAQRERVEGLERAEREIRGIEAELGGIRGELTDQQEPPAKDRVGELEDRIKALEDRAEGLIPSTVFVAPSVEAEGLTQGTVSRAAPPIIPVGN